MYLKREALDVEVYLNSFMMGKKKKTSLVEGSRIKEGTLPVSFHIPLTRVTGIHSSADPAGQM